MKTLLFYIYAEWEIGKMDSEWMICSEILVCLEQDSKAHILLVTELLVEDHDEIYTMSVELCPGLIMSALQSSINM